MKKSILIGAIAALMLFAFVACDNSTAGTGYDMMVISLQTESVPAVIKGQTPSESDYVVTGTRYNGEVFTVPAEDLKFNLTAASDVSADEDEAKEVGTVVYVGPYNGGLVTQGAVGTTLKALVYDLKGVEVKGPATPETYYEDVIGKTYNGKDNATAEDVFKKASYTVSALYEDFDGEIQKKALAADEYVVEGFVDTTVGKVEVTFKADINKDGTADTYTQDTDYNCKATVMIQSDSISTWSAEAAEDVEFVKGATATLPQATDFVVTVNYKSGASEKVTDGTGVTVGDKWVSGVGAEGATDAGKFNSTSAVVEVTYNETKQNVPFPVVANTITSFEVAYTGSPLSAGQNFTKAQLTITPDWLDDANPVVADSKDLNVTISENGVMPSAATGSHVFRITLTDYPEAGDGYVVVQVATAAAEKPEEDTGAEK